MEKMNQRPSKLPLFLGPLGRQSLVGPSQPLFLCGRLGVAVKLGGPLEWSCWWLFSPGCC